MKTVKGVDDCKRFAIIQEHLDGASKYSLVKKHGLSSRNRITEWMRKFGVENESKNVFLTEKVDPMKRESEEILQLRKEVKQLRKELAQATMEKDVWLTVVDVAEKQLKVDLRKKFVTK